MALNNQIIGSISGNLVADGDGNITGANFANITSNLQTFISNNGTDVKSVSIRSSTDANFTANYTLTLPVNDGSNGQSLITDGSGILSWTTLSTTSIENGNSNVVVYPNADVVISASGVEGVLTVDEVGIFVTGIANVTGDVQASANVNVTSNINATTFQNGNSNVTITANANVTITANSVARMVISDIGANITGNVNVSANINASTFQNGNSNIAIAGNANVTIASNNVANVVTITNGNLITGNGIGIILTSNNGSSIREVQLKTSTSASFTGNYSLTLPINDGNSGEVLTTDGGGVLSWSEISGGTNISNGNSNISIVGNAAINMSSNGKSNIFTVTSNSSTTETTIGNYQSSGSTVLSDASVNGVTITSPSVNGYFIDPPYNANGYPVVYAGGNSTQPYANGVISTTVGSYNMGGGDWTLEGWYYFFDAIGGTANAKPWSTTGNLSNNGSGVTSLRLWDSTGYRANQPGYVIGSNFYSCLNLPVSYNSWFHVAWVRSGLSFSMYINGNLTTVANSTGGDNRTSTTVGSDTFNFGSTSAPNVIFPGFTSGTYRTRLSNTALYTANFTPSTTYGNTSSTVFLLNVVDLPPYYEANVYTGNLFLSNTANFQGNIVMEGPSINLGFSSNLHILGGYSGYLLSTDGNGFLSWVSGPTGLANGTSNIRIPDAGGNINMSVGSNANVLVVTGTGANINGTANITGNFSTTGANVTLGPVGNVRITGGSSGQYLQTDGSGTLSWVSPSAGTAITNGNSNVNIPSSGGNVNTSVAGNTNILVVTGTGANITGYANITGAANIGGTANVTGNANVGNLGTATAIITTGNITTVNTGLVQNGNSNITITSNANITITANSNAVVAVTSSGDGNAQTTGGNVTGYWNVSGNVIGANLVGPLANGTSNIAITSNSNITLTAAGNSTMIISNTGANITGTGNFSGNVSAANFLGNFLGVLANGNSNVSIPDANGNVNISSAGNANVVTVTGSNVILSNAVPLTITGNNGTNLRTISLRTTNANANFTANYTLILPANVGTTGQVLITDGNNPANLSWGGISGGTQLVNGTSNVVVAFNGNITMSSGGVSPILTVTPSNAQFNGAALFNDAINANGGVVVGNISGIGTLTSTISFGNPDGNIRFYSTGFLAMNIANNGVYILGNGTANFAQVILNNTGNSANGGGQLYLNGASNNRIDFNQNGLAAPTNNSGGGRSAGTKIVLYPAIDSGNVDYAVGIVGGALWHSVPGSGEVFKWYGGTTEVANLSGTGVLTATSLKTSVGGTLVAVANNGSATRQVTIQASTDANFTGNYILTLPVNDGDSGQVLQTNGSGVLSWATVAGGASSNIANGNSNVSIPAAAGNVNISSNGVANVLVVTSTGANITGTLNANGNANVGNLGTATAIITTGNITTVNTGLVQNGNSNVTITANANVTITAKSNATMLITDTGANITGTGNFSGNVNALNFIGVLASGNSNVSIPAANGNVNISAVGVANVLVVTGTGANIAGTLNASGNANVGNLGTATAIITTGNITTVNTGLVQNGNSNIAITANANITLTAASNATLTITATGANITGTANVSGNANVGNLGTGALIATGAVNFTTSPNVSLGAVGNLKITGGTADYVLSTNGSGDLSWVAQSGGGGGGASISNGSSNVNIASSGGNVTVGVGGTSNVMVVTSTSANITGIANISGNIIGNGQLLIGTGTSSLLNPVAVFQGNGATFTQLALFNSQGNGSSDLVAYGNNGDDNQSFTDIGFTGNTFNDANYTITSPGDGYLFVQGNASFGGNLVIATGNTGTTKDIIFATGGFQTANAKARLFNANGLFSVTANISSGNANLGNLVTANFFSGQANLLTVDGGNAVGFRNVPINSQSAAYTTVLADSGKAIFHPTGDATRIYTIDSNANVAYPLGTVLTFINMSASNISIAITTDTLYLTGNGATGTRTLAQYGMASAIKMTSGASNTWIISGSGLT